jgi:hypothetical protein
MAGAGYKLFNTGDVLTAAQVNTYLNEQTVMVFASSAARTSALSGVLAEGMMSYLQDTNAVEVYNGSSWVNVGNAGDITEVQAGTGISVASGTGPIPIVTNTMATEITASGDIIVGTGSGTFDNLPIGSTGQVLTADTTVSPYKVKWATSSSGGMTLLGTTTLSGASVTFSSIPSTYVSLLLIGENFTNNTADGKFRVDANGAGWIARFAGVVSSGTFWRDGDILQTPNTYDRTNNDNGTALQIYNYTSSINYSMPFVWSGQYYAANGGLIGGGIVNASNGPITSLVLSNTGGTWAGGTVSLYGVK